MSLDFTKNEARNLVRFLRGENTVAYGVLNGRESCQVVGYDRNTRCVLVGGGNPKCIYSPRTNCNKYYETCKKR